jgi:hypothetical protein
MNTAESMWATAGRGSADVGEGAEVIQVELSWRDARSSTVLGVKEVKPGETLALGEKGDLLVPEEVLCAERAEIVRFDGETATAHVPPGGKLRLDGWPRDERELEIASGHVVEVTVGAFVVRLTRVRAEKRPAAAPLEGLKRGGFGVIAGSALMHAAVFAAIAFISPSLGASEEDPYDRDRILLMQRMLNASAQQEQETKPDDSAPSTGGDVNAGAQTRGAEGEAGKETAENKNARWSARGTATPETATLPREAVLNMAANFGLIGMLPGATQALNAPTLPWGTVLNGSDDDNKIGHLYGGSMDDAFGSGGWGLSGTGLGGGGPADAIGLNGLGGLGHTGTCVGPNCSGIGVGYGKPGGGYKPKARFPREAGPVTTNGHLPPEVIQRIVRQNFGRFSFCYQNGLKTNPNLEGRVTVKFIIGRDGGVQLSSDGGSDIPDTSVKQCVISSFAGMSFPAPDNGMVTVVYPLMFTPQ